MVQLIFEITWNCPCKCPFCQIPKVNKILQLSDYRKVLGLFRRYYEDDEYAVVLSGGEPSIVPSLRRYVEVAQELGFMVTIATNAYNIENVLGSRPDLIEISIDYYGRKHDELRGVEGLFDNAIRLLERASEEGIPTVVRSTLMKDNLRDILELRSFLNNSGLEETPILVMPVRGVKELKPTQQQIMRLQRYEGIYLSDNCPAGLSSFVVTPELEVLPCIFYRKRLGRFWKFTKEELDEIVREGAKIPRFPCEKN